MSGGLPGFGNTIITDTFHWRGMYVSLNIELKIWVGWMNTFFGSWRANSAVIITIPGDFLREKDLMKYWMSFGENGLGAW